MTLRMFLFAAVLAAGVAQADNAPAPVIENVATFLDQQRDIRDDLGSAKLRHIGSSERKRLLAAQDEMFGLLQGKRSIEQLSHDEQVALYNAQHLVAGILTDAELDRPICKREKRVGSNMAQTVCRTKRQMAQHREDLDRNLRGPRNCAGADCMSTRGGGG